MAKTQRSSPMKNYRTRVEDKGHGVLNKRARIALKRLKHYVSLLDGDLVYEIAVEIGLDECMVTFEGEQAMFDLTNLQPVSLTAALAAYVEYRDGSRFS